MGKRTVSGNTISMNHEVNIIGPQVGIRSREQKAWPDLAVPAKDVSSGFSAVLPSLLASVPVSGNGGGDPLALAAMGSLCMASRVSLSPGPSGSGYLASYVNVLQKLMTGAYSARGSLDEEKLKKMILMLVLEMMQKAGPGFSSWKEVLMDAMEHAALGDFMKGVRSAVCAMTGDPVNANTGNFVYEKEDLVVSGAVPLKFRRFYNRIDERSGVMGKGWRHNYEIRLIMEEDRYVLLKGDGQEETYLREENGEAAPLFGMPGRLRRTEDGYEYQTWNNQEYVFDQEGRLVQTREKNKKRLGFSYDSQRRLVRVSNCHGAWLDYQYDRNTGMLVQVRDHTGRKIALSYELGRLKEVRNGTEDRYQYDYDKEKRLYRIRNPRGVYVLENEYDEKGRTIRQAFADGGEIRYAYEEKENRTLMTDQRGNRVAYERDGRYRNVKTIYGDGEERFCYNDRNQLLWKTDKRGNKTRYAYDDKGNRTQILYPDGEKRNMTYDSDSRLLVLSVNGVVKQKNTYDQRGNLIKIEDALGNCQEAEYDENGSLIKIIQPDGSQVSVKYDNRGNIACITDGSGNDNFYQYDECNRVILVMDGNANQTHFSYNASNQVASIINAAGKRRTYEYGPNGKITKQVDFNGAVTIQKYNKMNQVETCILPDGETIQMKYDMMQNMICKTLPNGAEVRYGYDGQNRLNQVILPTGGEIRYEYDADGNRTAMTDPNGSRTLAEYDERNRLIKVTDPAGNSTQYVYDRSGRLVRIVDAMDHARVYEYNEADQIIKETDIFGNTICYEYTKLGKVASITDGKKGKTTYGYEAGGILVYTAFSDGGYEHYQYDKNGNLVRQQNEKGDYLEFIYNSLNQRTGVKSSFGQEQYYTYNETGKMTSITDTRGNKTCYEYSPGGKLRSVLDAAGNRTEYAYDDSGNLKAICQHKGQEILLEKNGALNSISPNKDLPRITTFQRDLLGNIEAVTNPLGFQKFYQYNLAGQRIRKIDEDGYETCYSYLGTGNIRQITYADGRSVNYSYDPLGRLIKIEDWLGKTDLIRTDTGRIKKVVDYQGHEFAYSWGKLGERKAFFYPDGRKVSYEYDDDCRLSYLADGKQEIQFFYHKDGTLAEKKFSNGLSSHFHYNALGLLSCLTHKKDGEILEKYDYGYDLAGNKTSIRKVRKAHAACALPEYARQQLQDENGFYEYFYDNMNRIKEVRKDKKTQRKYEYDAFGNRIRMTEGDQEISYCYNRANQLVRETGRDGDKIYQYDARGNVTGIDRKNQAINRYCYDERNRLSMSWNADGRLARYEYDGMGNRVSAQEFAVEKKVSDGGKEPDIPIRSEEYILDYTKPFHNLVGKTETVKGKRHTCSYIWDSGLEFLKDGKTEYVCLQDELGSAVRLVEAEEQRIYGFDEFGNSLYGKDGQMPFGYTGYIHDPIAGAYFAQAREYFPQTGRFAGNDMIPGDIADPSSLNRYWYCRNAPLNWVDPDGKKPEKLETNSWWDFFVGDSPFLNEEKKRENQLKDQKKPVGLKNDLYNQNELTRLDKKTKELFMDTARIAGESMDYLAERADAMVDVNVEAGVGLGDQLHLGVADVVFSVKLACWGMDEHGEITPITSGKLGGVVAGREYSVEVGFDYEKEKAVLSLTADKLQTDSDVKLTFGNELYASIGGGGSVTINLSEMVRTVEDAIEAIFGCESQK